MSCWYLLDTCVISELRAKYPDANVVKWIGKIADDCLFLSVITIGEVKRGIEKLVSSPKQQELDAWLREKLLPRFKDRILGIDVNVVLVWGVMVARLEKQGRILPGINSLVAAIALSNNMNLVTRNEKDFEGTGVEIINPWSSGRDE